jgi:general secretion pathway protein I
MPTYRNDHPNRPIGPRTDTPSAFTLMEVLVALAIVAIAVVGLLRLHLMSLRLTERAETTARAAALAEEKIAESLAHGYPALGSEAGQESRGPRTLQWQRDVTELRLPRGGRDEQVGLRQIVVRVRSPEDVEPAVSLSTCVADRRLP